MVVAQDGAIERSMYRIFRIKEGDEPNDYQMLREVLQRRFKDTSSQPELVLIDGGKGQLSSVKDVVPNNIFLMGISKGKHLKRVHKTQLDEFWIYKSNNVLRIELDTPQILIDLRNEAHRFAISYYRKRSIKESKRSVLDKIEGVGPKRSKELIKSFGSIQGIKKASLEEVLKVVKNRKVAKQIIKDISNL